MDPNQHSHDPAVYAKGRKHLGNIVRLRRTGVILSDWRFRSNGMEWEMSRKGLEDGAGLEMVLGERGLRLSVKEPPPHTHSLGCMTWAHSEFLTFSGMPMLEA